MEIVIKIPEELYKQITVEKLYFLEDGENLCTAVENGTPLSKGHGRLIDGDKLELDTEWDDYYDGFTSYSEMQIKEAPTIIEADKESEE